jgi:hypothetical protein
MELKHECKCDNEVKKSSDGMRLGEKINTSDKLPCGMRAVTIG